MDGVIVKVAVIDNLHSRLCLLCDRLLIRSNYTVTLLHSPDIHERINNYFTTKDENIGVADRCRFML